MLNFYPHTEKISKQKGALKAKKYGIKFEAIVRISYFPRTRGLWWEELLDPLTVIFSSVIPRKKSLIVIS